MAHLCIAKGDDVSLLPLGQTDSVEVRVRNGVEYTFHSRPARGDQEAGTGKTETRRLMLIPWEEAGKLKWALICSRGGEACVNGAPVISGLHILADRDAITLGERASPVFFLDEDPARIQPFPGARDPIKCRRCSTPILKGDPAVRCPSCGQWYHQETRGKDCWTYKDAKHCLQCKYPTSLDGTFSWTPAGL